MIFIVNWSITQPNSSESGIKIPGKKKWIFKNSRKQYCLKKSSCGTRRLDFETRLWKSSWGGFEAGGHGIWDIWDTWDIFGKKLPVAEQ